MKYIGTRACASLRIYSITPLVYLFRCGYYFFFFLFPPSYPLAVAGGYSGWGHVYRILYEFCADVCGGENVRKVYLYVIILLLQYNRERAYCIIIYNNVIF